MARILRQATAVTLTMGPALDNTDGVTAETGLSPTVYVSKNGAAQAARNSASAISHDRDGYYRVPLSATDTDTLGHTRVQFTDAATHLPVWEDCEVWTTNAWDTFYSTDRLDVNVKEVSDSSSTADNLETVYTTISSAAQMGLMAKGTATAVGSATITLAAGFSASSNNIIGSVVVVESATAGAYQARVISGWNNTTKVADVDPAWTTTPTGTVTYIVFFAAPATTTTPPAVNLTQWLGSTPNSLTSGRVDAIVGAYASGSAPLQPTTAGRTLDVTATGAAGIDWGNVENPTTANGLTGTTIATSQVVASVTGNVGGNVTGNVGGDVQGNVDGNVGGNVTGNVGGNVTGSVGSLAAQAKADVNAEVVDALATDTYAEPGQGTPAATAALSTKISYLFKAWRNRHTVTANEYALYADDGTTKDQEASVADDTTTFDRGEMRTGL